MNKKIDNKRVGFHSIEGIIKNSPHKIKKLFIVLFLFASTSHAAVISLGCDDGDFEFFKYYLIKMDTNKKTAERTLQYIYGGERFGLPRGFSREWEKQKNTDYVWEEMKICSSCNRNNETREE